MLIDKKGVSSMAHVDQMKEYKCLGEPNELAGLGCWDREMVRVTDTRERPDGEVEYLVLWRDSAGDRPLGYPLESFLQWEGRQKWTNF